MFVTDNNVILPPAGGFVFMGAILLCCEFDADGAVIESLHSPKPLHSPAGGALLWLEHRAPILVAGAGVLLVNINPDSCQHIYCQAKDVLFIRQPQDAAHRCVRLGYLV